MRLIDLLIMGGRTSPAAISAEYQDLIDALGQAAADTCMRNRYGNDVLPLPLTFAEWAANFSAVGDEARDPTFGTPMRVAQAGIDQINMERPHHNGTYWFMKTGTSRWEIWDNDGVKVGANRDLRIGTVNPTDGVRWHATNPNILFYPIANQIYYFDIRNNTKAAVVTSPNGILGTGNRKLAGGDGNICVEVNGEAWILITHGGTNTNAQVLVLGDPDNPAANDYKIVSHNWTGTEWELVYENWTTGATKWDFPTGTLFDYATLTMKDPANNWPYILVAADGRGTEMTNLSGTLIGSIDSNSNHMNQVLSTVGGTDYMTTVKKTVPGMIPPAINTGDAQAWYMTVDASGATMLLTVNGFVALDWGSGFNSAGGGQYGSLAIAADGHKCLIAMNSAVEAGATDWQAYYSEIDELQLNRDAGDNTPRRLLHHWIDLFGTVGRQPEAWFSQDGTHGFFKTNIGGLLPNNGYLFYFKCFGRTPVAQRP